MNNFLLCAYKYNRSAYIIDIVHILLTIKYNIVVHVLKQHEQNATNFELLTNISYKKEFKMYKLLSS